MIRCKITVVRRSFNEDFVDEYVEPERKKTLGPCELFRDGQEFVTDVFTGVPQGFCPWAWDDIYKSLVGFAADGHFGMWYRDRNTIIACCTDGTRPVYFRIEKLKD